MNEKILLETLILIVFAGITIQWIAWKIKFPGIVLLLFTGILLGPVFDVISSELIGGPSLHALLKIALAIILFEGGLQLKFHELKESGSLVNRITTFACPIHFSLLFVGAHFILNLDVKVSLILASILIVTGPTVILPLLRQARIPKHISAILKWEGIIIDPVGALLTVLFYQFAVNHDSNLAITQLFFNFFISVIFSTLLAIISAYLIRYLFEKSDFPEHIKVPFVFSLLLLVYFVSDLIQHESGVMTATLFGIFLGNMKLSTLEEIHKFKENTTVILISLVFIVLSSTLNFEDLKMLVEPKFIFFILFVLLVARPITVFLSFTKSTLSSKEKFFVSWIAPRGIVAAAVTDVFAPKLIAAGMEEAKLLIPLIFVIIIVTVVFQGLSLNALSKKLLVNESETRGMLIVGANPWSQALSETLKELNYHVVLADSSWTKLQNAKMSNLNTFYGEVLSDTSEALLDLTDISKVLTTTDNDSYNNLVCKRFSSSVGTNSVYQIPIHTAKNSSNENLKMTLIGKTILKDNITYEELGLRFYLGWKFQKTKLTDEFTWESFQEKVTSDSILLIGIRPNLSLYFLHNNNKANPKKGDTIISFTPPEKEEQS